MIPNPKIGDIVVYYNSNNEGRKVYYALIIKLFKNNMCRVIPFLCGKNYYNNKMYLNIPADKYNECTMYNVSRYNLYNCDSDEPYIKQFTNEYILQPIILFKLDMLQNYIYYISRYNPQQLNVLNTQKRLYNFNITEIGKIIKIYQEPNNLTFNSYINTYIPESYNIFENSNYNANIEQLYKTIYKHIYKIGLEEY